MKVMLITASLVLLAGYSAAAQEEESQQEAQEAVRAVAAVGLRSAAGQLGVSEELLRAIRLPGAAEEARETGIPDREVREVLKAAKAHALRPGEAQFVIEAETRAVKDKGPIDNFGAFVKTKLDQGLRGRALADAIHAEHAARGKGKGYYKTQEKRGDHADSGHAGEPAEARGKRLKQKGTKNQEITEEETPAR